MARPQTFDKSIVLGQVMHIFWNQGYTNTSIKDLTRVTKLQPGSLYGAFKNKRNLFINSLDLYFDNLFIAVTKILHTEEAPLKRIENFFDFILSQKNDDKEIKSCLLVNTLLEIPPQDIEINHRVSDMFKKIETEFCKVLEQAELNNTLVHDSEPKALAKMLMSGIFGLQIYNRMKPAENSLEDIVYNLLNNIKNKV